MPVDQGDKRLDLLYGDRHRQARDVLADLHRNDRRRRDLGASTAHGAAHPGTPLARVREDLDHPRNSGKARRTVWIGCLRIEL